MASIAGSQYVATDGATAVNVVITSDGSNLPAAVAGDFNLEVWTGGGAPSSPASGYQGLMVDYSGMYANLLSGAFQLADTGSSGSSFIEANFAGETIVGAPGDIIETQGANDSVTGNGNVILGYGNNTTFNLATGNNSLFTLGGNGDTVIGGSGNSFVFFEGTGNKFSNAGSGNDTIIANTTSSNDSLTAGSGSDLFIGLGSGDTINAGSGSDTVIAEGSNESVTGGSGALTAYILGSGDTLSGISASTTAYVMGSSDVVNASGAASVALYAATNATFVDTSPAYQDTIVGFSNASGDTINLTHNTATTLDTYANTVVASANSGADTLITLHDNSTILLKGITSSSVTSGFFS
jgi:Ca2+-binding RTX toxin-like protein